LEGLITYVIYGAVIYMLLEPHAHLWPHPDVLKIAVPRKKGAKKATKRKPAKKRKKRRR
jgi:hypothetical protein